LKNQGRKIRRIHKLDCSNIDYYKRNKVIHIKDETLSSSLQWVEAFQRNLNHQQLQNNRTRTLFKRAKRWRNIAWN